jgi:tetratricopeptide (TPR) repeat protein
MEGRLEDALWLCERAMAKMGELDNLREYARLKLAVAHIQLGMDEPDVARVETILNSALPDLRDHGSHVDLGLWNGLISSVLLFGRDASGAEGRARQALELLGSGTAPDERANALLTLHDSLIAQGRRDEAGECLFRARDAAVEAGEGRALAALWRDLAERAHEFGEHQLAVEAYRVALDASSVRDRSRAVRAVARELSRRHSLSAHSEH